MERITERINCGFVCVLCLAIHFAFVDSTVIASQPNADEHSRPNILIIYLDDFGWRDCGYLGSDFYQTPNIDQLASQSISFSNAYAAAANCAPSRASMLTGLYTPRHQIFNVGTRLRGNPQLSRLIHVPGTDTLPSNLLTYPQIATRLGYTTMNIGKWHLSDNPRDYGFQRNIGGSHSGSPPRGYFPPHTDAPGLESAPEGEYLTDRLTSEAVQFIENASSEPWLLQLSHFAVHSPFQAKSSDIKKYEQIPAGKLHRNPVMAAMIDSVDAGIGKILDTLDRLKVRENTLILFSSDNGGVGSVTDMAPLRGYKGTYYEGGIRVPLLISCPKNWQGIEPNGTQVVQPVSQIDFLPTLCDVWNCERLMDPTTDGTSLLPILRGERLEERALYWHFPAYLEGRSKSAEQRDPLFRNRPCSAIRLGDWKLIEYFEDRLHQPISSSAGLELYNLANDISESVNLAETETTRCSDLHRRLREWQKQVGAPIPTTPNPSFDASFHDKQLRKASQQSQ